ncbi:hypothetical protein [Streptomyces sp. ITFR-16]|uniref:hypothetical protein n=1 Tax=Streptomyces sp. ITFR-16 TaxID=3075198 RepID=UPI00288ADFFC|nr:hypothetical protein [Streptomyces sp. ITFR-16]WNI20415.1 hypothetical protein RLT58_00060 [Streptomyces sp. ITFR-16]
MALTNHLAALTIRLAADGPDKGAGGGLIPPATPTEIPGLGGTVSTLFGYALWLLLIAGAGGVGFGVFKLAVSEKGRGGSASEPFKWMGSGIAAILLSGSLIAILNGIAGS